MEDSEKVLVQGGRTWKVAMGWWKAWQGGGSLCVFYCVGPFFTWTAVKDFCVQGLLCTRTRVCIWVKDVSAEDEAAAPCPCLVHLRKVINTLSDLY